MHSSACVEGFLSALKCNCLPFPNSSSSICFHLPPIRCLCSHIHHHHHHLHLHRNGSFITHRRSPCNILIQNSTHVVRVVSDYDLLALDSRSVNAEHGTDEMAPSQTLHPLEDEDGKPLELKERWRRCKISQANKGKVPWNKGRRHPPETIARIKARTFQAMQNPRIREKLKRFGKSQSKETRKKISVTIKKWWSTVKSAKKRQATCIAEWQESIAEAARKGGENDQEYQWGSFQLLKKELEKERRMMAQKRMRNSSKSTDHRMKIAESIRAKWSDPDFRQNVMQGLQRYSDTKERSGVDKLKRTRRKKVAKEGSTIEISKNSAGSITRSDCDLPKLSSLESQIPEDVPKLYSLGSQRPEGVSTYNDPSTDMKLDIVRQIRANRLAKAGKRKEAADRARILMAEAERAVRTLEIAATWDQDALGPLVEARKLLAEAANSLQAAGLLKVDQFHAPLTSSTNVNVTSTEQPHLSESQHVPSVVQLKDEEHKELSLTNTNVKLCDNEHHYINGASMSGAADFGSKSDITGATLEINASPGCKPANKNKPRKQWVKGKLVLLEVD